MLQGKAFCSIWLSQWLYVCSINIVTFPKWHLRRMRAPGRLSVIMCVHPPHRSCAADNEPPTEIMCHLSISVAQARPGAIRQHATQRALLRNYTPAINTAKRSNLFACGSFWKTLGETSNFCQVWLVAGRAGGVLFGTLPGLPEENLRTFTLSSPVCGGIHRCFGKPTRALFRMLQLLVVRGTVAWASGHSNERSLDCLERVKQLWRL